MRPREARLGDAVLHLHAVLHRRRRSPRRSVARRRRFLGDGHMVSPRAMAQRLGRRNGLPHQERRRRRPLVARPPETAAPPPLRLGNYAHGQTNVAHQRTLLPHLHRRLRDPPHDAHQRQPLLLRFTHPLRTRLRRGPPRPLRQKLRPPPLQDRSHQPLPPPRRRPHRRRPPPPRQGRQVKRTTLQRRPPQGLLRYTRRYHAQKPPRPQSPQRGLRP
mmetsp:Transcript_13357/g.43522  ORF Transcript_13357/g.43522 Transcript_13357/m.43522 type:complete len:217 (+) Transcript_13357:595-1245(+)